MTRLERRRLVLNASLGLSLTALVIAADLGGRLRALERWLYDARARHCQLFARPPTDRLVHLDVDDASLEEIGRWPWPRQVLAEVVDELRAAGARVIGLDVLLTEAAAPDGDAALAAALSRAGCVVLPASFGFEPQTVHSTVYSRAYDHLLRDLELRPDALRASLNQDTGPPLTAEEVAGVYFLARREAVRARLEGVIEAGGQTDPADVRRRLTPRAHAAGVRTDADRVVERQLPIVESILELRRFARPKPEGATRFLTGVAEVPPVPALARVTGQCGFVDFLRFDDGTVRSVPLWIEHGGAIYPQFALVMACAMLGVRPEDLRLAPGHVAIPDPADPARDLRRVPVRTVVADRRGDRFDAFMDVPWVGTSDWRTMYGPRGPDGFRQHLPVTQVWAPRENVRSIERNNRQADVAIEYVLTALLEDRALADYQRTRLDPRVPGSRLPMTMHVLKLLALDESTAGYLAAARAGESDAATAALAPEERGIVRAVSDLLRITESNRRIADDLARQRRRLREQIEGRAVLVGLAATGYTDSRPTSLHSDCPGVVIHGTIVNAILSGELWTHAPRWLTAVVTGVIGLLTTAAVARLSPWRATAVAAGLVVVYLLVNGIVLFDRGDYLLGTAGPVAVAGAVWGACTLARYVVESSERARITHRFRSYVDPALVEHVVAHPETLRLEGERREVTVCFSDLEGFTAMSESLRERVVPILNRYMGVMVPLIRRRRGYVNKFLGDGIMFFFGAPLPNPDHAADAVETALRMRRAMRGFNAWLARQGLEPRATRVGISTDHVTLGDAGSLAGRDADRASDYTVLGDAVNLAARLEPANKVTGTTILATRQTVDRAGPRFLFRPIGRVRVAGRSECEMVFEPLARSADATPEQRRLAELTREVVDAFGAGDFDRCIDAADRLEAFAPSEATLCDLYRTWCRRYQSEPPPAGFCGEIDLGAK